MHPHKLAEFEREIVAAIDRITTAPTRTRQRFITARCEFVRVFPYQIWYLWDDEHQVVGVIAFLHAHQSRIVLEQRE